MTDDDIDYEDLDDLPLSAHVEWSQLLAGRDSKGASSNAEWWLLGSIERNQATAHNKIWTARL